jgi:hypothetical protein
LALNSSYAGFSAGIKQKQNYQTVLAINAFQDYVKGIHKNNLDAYFKEEKEKKVNKECIY